MAQTKATDKSPSRATQPARSARNKNNRALRRIRRLKTQPKQDFTGVLGGKNHARVMRRINTAQQRERLKREFEAKEALLRQVAKQKETEASNG